MHLVLIGLRCSGKTTAGAALARTLNIPFIDLDDRTAALLKAATPADALRTQGQPAFRAAEVTALKAVLARQTPSIIALGGGTPTAPGATAVLLDAQGSRDVIVVYLRATAEVLMRRMHAGGAVTRPSLTGTNPIDEVPTILAQRDASYLRIADRTIDASKPTDEVVGELAALFTRP